ncbi:CDC45-like protein [Trichodelitschia bisporula]|uniref:CDC45-like protein n=1 Tax=Trichodelitschia bisporula TaxID=703511 RepID=A0A6G1HWM7_9PEZI|nr:CDC45-like protein [Trichodelitschia bisporula]
MYLPRNLISHLYLHLKQTHHPTSPPVLILVSLDPDALCACRILTALFKRDFIPHKIKPISGYGDLMRVGTELVRPMRTTDGGSGGVVVCLGVGGMVDLEAMLGLEVDEQGNGGMGDVEIWVVDARRPWNLSNVFGMQNLGSLTENGEPVAKVKGVEQGRISESYRPGRGAIVVFDDGDIEDELASERTAYCALAEMPELGEDDEEFDDGSDSGSDTAVEDDVPESGQSSRKRKSPSDPEDSDSEADEGTPHKKRRSNSSSSIPSTPERPARRGLLVTEGGPSSDTDIVHSGSPSEPGSPARREPSARKLRQRLLRLRRQYGAVLRAYYDLGASYSEPISSLIYSLACDLGRDDNDLLWLTIVGVSSLEISGRTSNGLGLSPLSTSGRSSGWTRDRGERIRAVLRDEVRRLNPTDLKDVSREANLGEASGVIQTHARSPTDMAIHLSPEPRFLLVRHWSLYDSMLHSPYLSAKLRVWSDAGRRRLHKLLAKMGISLTQCRQAYTHMDLDIKRSLRDRLLKFAPQYGLDGLVPPEVGQGTVGKEGWGFVRCWGWKACLSAMDVGIILGAILEVGDLDPKTAAAAANYRPGQPQSVIHSGISTPGSRTGPAPSTSSPGPQDELKAREEALMKRFWTAYDSLGSVDILTSHIITAQHLYRAILRTGTSLLEKRQIRPLRAFRMAVVKEGPDVELFTHPGALIKLALWIAEAIGETEGDKGRKGGELVMAGLDEERGIYVVVGLGGGAAVMAQKEREARRKERKAAREKKRVEKRAGREKRKQARREQLEALGEEWDEDDLSESEEESDSEDESDDEEEEREERGKALNRFGNAFQEVIAETGARVRVDNFEHCVVEVRKEDLGGFLENLSMKAVVG